MAGKIRFYRLRRTRDGFTCMVRSDDREKADKLFFSLSPCPGVLDNDTIACTLTLLCGERYDEIELGLPVSEEVLEDLRVFTKARLITPPAEGAAASLRRLRNRVTGQWSDIWYEPGEEREPKRVLLNFSGGFDSLALYALLPRERVDLVSVDFGGWFQREADFFRSFNPYTLSTNFRMLGYARDSWKYMGAGAMLYSRLLAGDHAWQAFGSMMEEVTSSFRDHISLTMYDPPNSTLGLNSLPLAQGITEVGAAIVVSCYFPEVIDRSLTSLGLDGSEKHYRKQVLVDIVNERFHRGLTLEPYVLPEEKFRVPFGSDLVLDFLGLYELKHRGAEVVGGILTDIPEEALRLAEELSLAFYEKYSPRYLEYVPDDIRLYYLERLNEAGMSLWNEKDMAEYFQIRDFLSAWHPGVLDPQ